MTQEEIARQIARLSNRLGDIAISALPEHNREKQIIVKDIKQLAEMLVFIDIKSKK